MTLENIFVCSDTIKKYSHGPLGRLQDAYCQWLISHRFAISTIRVHISRLSYLNDFLEKKGLKNYRQLTVEHIQSFLADHFSKSKDNKSSINRYHRMSFSINRFEKFLQESVFCKKKLKTIH